MTEGRTALTFAVTEERSASEGVKCVRAYRPLTAARPVRNFLSENETTLARAMTAIAERPPKSDTALRESESRRSALARRI
jgi:hypothetical protein